MTACSLLLRRLLDAMGSMLLFLVYTVQAQSMAWHAMCSAPAKHTECVWLWCKCKKTVLISLPAWLGKTWRLVPSPVRAVLTSLLTSLRRLHGRCLVMCSSLVRRTCQQTVIYLPAWFGKTLGLLPAKVPAVLKSLLSCLRRLQRRRLWTCWRFVRQTCQQTGINPPAWFGKTLRLLPAPVRAVLKSLLWSLRRLQRLQSRLIKVAGHWQQHRASLNQPRNHTFSSRTNTTAAELYYLRHMRSCAAAATGNKDGNPSPRTALQISAASFIGRLLQSIMRHCYFTVFLLLHSLLQSIGQMVRYYAKIAMKPIIVSFAILWLSLRPPSPPQNKKEKQTP